MDILNGAGIAEGFQTIEMAGTGSDQTDFITVGRDGTLFLACNSRKLGSHKTILKQPPGEIIGEIYVRASAKNYDEDSSTLESLGVIQFMGLWSPTESDALLFSDHTRIKSIEDHKVKTVVKTDFQVGKFVCLKESDIWFFSASQPQLYRAKNGSHKRVSGHSQASEQIGSVDGPLEFARYSNPSSTSMTISRRSGAIYIAQKTKSWCGIRRIRNGFVQLAAGGSQTNPTDSDCVDGPIHQAKLTAVHGLAINSQEEIIFGAYSSVRIVSNSKISTIFQSPPNVSPGCNFICTSQEDIIYSPTRLLFSDRTLEINALKRPSSFSPSGVSYSDYCEILRQRTNTSLRDPFEHLHLFPEPTLDALLDTVDTRLDPKKYISISSASGTSWNLHTAVLQLRCPYLLKENVRTSFASLSYEAQAFILTFIFGERIADASLVDDAEFDHAARICGLSRLSDYLRQRFSQLIRIPRVPLFDYLVELIRKLPDEVSADFVDLIVVELKKRTDEIPGRIEQLRQLFPDPDKTRAIIAKLQGSISLMILYVPPTSNSQAPVGEISKLIAPLLPWNPRVVSDKLLFSSTATQSLSTSSSFLRSSSSSMSLSSSGITSLKQSSTAIKLTKPSIPTDFTITCRETSFPCHKWLLLARWPYFRNALASGDLENVPNSLTIEIVPTDFLEALLIHIYTGDTGVFANMDRCLVFFQKGPELTLLNEDLSANMDFFHLRDFCVNFASHDLDCSNVLKKLQIARLLRDKELRVSCLKFVIQNFAEILSNPASLTSWTSLGADILIHCFQKQYSVSSDYASDILHFVDTAAGNGRRGLRNSATLTACFNNPSGIAISYSGELFVSDTDNHVIRAFRPGGKTRTLAGKGIEGYDYGTFDKAQFAQPLGVAVSPEGEVYVADHNNDRIRVLRNGEVKTFAGVGRKKNPTLKLSDSSTALKSSEITLPTTICFYGSTLYASQTARHVILVISDNSVSVYAGSSTPLLVVSPSDSDLLATPSSQSINFETYQHWKGYEDGPRLSARFDSPHGLCVANNGDLYVADSGNHCIRLVSVDSVSTFAGTGKVLGFKDGPIQDALFNFPTDIAIGKDRFYITDSANHCVRMILDGKVTTVGGNGVGGFSDGFGPFSSFCFPSSLAIGNNGEVYVADSGNNRIRILSEVKLPNKQSNPDTLVKTPNASSLRSGIRIFPPIRDLRLLYEIADVKWVHRASTSEFLLHSPILKLRTPELLEPSSPHLKDILNSPVTDASFNIFVDFLYCDQIPESTNLMSVLEVIHLMAISGNPGLMTHAQFLLAIKLDQITDSSQIVGTIRTLLTLESPTELLDMIVPKLRFNAESIGNELLDDPTMPHGITDIFKKVNDLHEPLTAVPTTSPIVTSPLTSIVASMLPPHDLLKVDPYSSLSSIKDESQFSSIDSSKGFSDRYSSGPESSSPPESLAFSPSKPFSSSGSSRLSYAFPTAQKPSVLKEVPPDTLVSFGSHKIACHSWLLMTRWPHLKKLVSDAPIVAQGVLPDDSIPPELGEHVLSRTITKMIQLPHVPSELIAAIILHLYTGSYSDLDRLNPLVLRFEDILGIPTNSTNDDDGWTLMGSPDPLSLENCAQRLKIAMKSDSDVDIDTVHSFILQRLGILLSHPSIGPQFKKSLPSDIIASLITELYGQVWHSNPA